MKILNARFMRSITKLLVAIFVATAIASLNTTPANAFAGTLENGNLAYAQSEFNKGAACNYLPGFETGYDAWHWILTTRGATFQQDPRNPAVAINLNIVYMRQDGSLFVIKSGAWVQTGKGAYTYTPVADRIRLVQAGTVALINGSDSGIRLSHTCPGSGSIVTPTSSPSSTASPAATASPTPTASSSPRPTTSPSPTPTATSTSTPRPTTSASPTPTASASASPTASPSPTTIASPSPSPSLSPSPSPTSRPTSTVIPTLAPRPSARASAVQIRPTASPNALPTPTPSPQGIESSPTPSPSSSPTVRPTPAPTPTPERTPSPQPSPTTTQAPPVVLPIPPVVEDPKKVEFVDPGKPLEIDPTTFPDPPASKIEVTKEPTLGDLVTNNDGTFTYTPPAQAPAAPAVDVVEFTYTNLSGEAVILRKEFVMTVKGDVPSIIQTGFGGLSNPLNVAFIMLLLLSLAVITKFVKPTMGKNNA